MEGVANEVGKVDADADELNFGDDAGIEFCRWTEADVEADADADADVGDTSDVAVDEIEVVRLSGVFLSLAEAAVGDKNNAANTGDVKGDGDTRVSFGGASAGIVASPDVLSSSSTASVPSAFFDFFSFFFLTDASAPSLSFLRADFGRAS